MSTCRSVKKLCNISWIPADRQPTGAPFIRRSQLSVSIPTASRRKWLQAFTWRFGTHSPDLSLEPFRDGASMTQSIVAPISRCNPTAGQRSIPLLLPAFQLWTAPQQRRDCRCRFQPVGRDGSLAAPSPRRRYGSRMLHPRPRSIPCRIIRPLCPPGRGLRFLDMKLD